MNSQNRRYCRFCFYGRATICAIEVQALNVMYQKRAFISAIFNDLIFLFLKAEYSIETGRPIA
jgi:hypothetical protein